MPVNKNVIVQVKANDVIQTLRCHPSASSSMPCREGCNGLVQGERTGMFYGQCSELCGRNHAFMPIAVRVVTDEEFAAWLDSQRRARRATMPAR